MSVEINFNRHFYFEMITPEEQKKQLVQLANTKMPFGKYEGYYLIDIPEYYIVWYKNKGFPEGKLGEQLALIYEIKLNGLENMIRSLRTNR